MPRLLAALLIAALFAVACDDDPPAPAADDPADGALPTPDAAPTADGALPDAAPTDAVPPDARPLDAAPPTPDVAPPDARPLDAEPPSDATPPDAAPPAPDAAPPECLPPEPFDYACDALAPETCPGGACLFGLCLGPIRDADRWAACDDGACGPCEDAASCPADCAPRPDVAGVAAYDPATTITVRLGGFNLVGAGDFEDRIYGSLDGFSGVGGGITRYVPRIDGRDDPAAADQFVSFEYYGARPAEWLTVDQIAEIESYDYRTTEALHRYALIAAFFIRHRLELSGATHAAIVCHSMGCHVTRYLIEHDLAGLASEGRINRWVSFTGVIAGARLARLFDNPDVREIAEVLQFNTSDFVHMNPDYVVDASARWNHRPYAADNPNFTGIAIHHLVASDPRVSQTADIVRLLDLNNPDDEPNDGIVYSFDQFFHAQADAVRLVTAEGDAVLPTRTWLHVDHERVKEDHGAAMVAAAALYHRRRAWVTLREIQLFDDGENDGPFDFDDLGPPPSEVSLEVDVSFGAYALEAFGEAPIVHRLRPDDDERSSDLVVIPDDQPTPVDLLIYAGPVYDDQPSLRVRAEVLEMDNYRRYGVFEDLFDPHERLIQFEGDLPLEDGLHELANGDARVVIEVRMGSLP